MNTDLTQKIVTDYKVLVSDAEELIKATTTQSVEKIADARSRMQHALLELKPRLANTEAVLKDKTRLAASAADEYVHHNPWAAMGAAAGVGVVIGLLIGRH
jgi:ElaB/YqjD/DUF883 family membrane-anchored ribosome-binding protein